ncbi:MAG TPA: hypothetical protein VLX29_10510 [Nitrospirota bacterium]|nr:hypothetical protein [Nitrospirota bacterium]
MATVSKSLMPILLLIMFGVVFATSAILVIKTPAPLQHAGVNHNNRLDAEAMAFDLILRLLLAVKITVLRSIGL